MNLTTRNYRLQTAPNGLALGRNDDIAPEPGPGQVLLRVAAASLNYRDLLTLQDANGNRSGLVPLSDGAGTVVTVGPEVQRWKLGDRVSPNFFTDWHAGAFSPTYLASGLGGGQTDGVLRDHMLVDAASLWKCRPIYPWLRPPRCPVRV